MNEKSEGRGQERYLVKLRNLTKYIICGPNKRVKEAKNEKILKKISTKSVDASGFCKKNKCG